MEMARSSTSPSDRSDTPGESPTSGSHDNISTKDGLLLMNEIESLNKTLSTVSNQAARSFTRQNWRKCLVGGSEKEQSYLVRALLKYGTPHVYARVVQEYGERLLQAANEDFLDKVVEARLRTIGAKELVALLAKTNRLGYDEEDVVDDEEDVMPAQEIQEEERLEVEEPQPPVAPDAVMAGTHQSDSLLEEQNRNRAAAAMAQAMAQAAAHQAPTNQRVDLPTRRKSSKSSGKFVCPDCHAPFSQQGGLTYHIERRVCHRPPPTFKWFCRKCSKGFTTSGGKVYHEQNKVCENHEKAAATSSAVAANPPLMPHLQDGLPPAHYGPGPSTYQPPPPANGPHQHLPPYAGPPYNQNGPHGGFLGFQNATPLQSRPPSEVEQNGYNRNNYSDHHTPIRSATQTPTAKSSPVPESSPGEIRVLDPATQAELNARLEAEVKRFEDKCREIPDTLTAAEREEEINKQKRGHATRKSQIRKKYGIQVRSSKNRAANFVRVSGQEDAPHLEPIARIGAFRAPSAGRTTFSVTTPKIYEQGRARSTEERPDLKRRRIESSSPDDDPHAMSWSDAYGVPGGPQRRVSEGGETMYQQAQNPELNDLSKSAVRALTQLDTAGRKKVPIGAAQKQWEALQALQPAPSLTSAGSSSRPQSSHTPLTSRANSLVEPIVVDSSSESISGADSDPDEEIPARLPPGRSRRKSTSPRAMETQSPVKGMTRRDSTTLPSPLSKAGTKLRAIVPA